MPVLDRLVRHLRLAATREDHARHGRVLIEDALRTASLGDDSRLVVVRRLDLGPIPAKASATAWSRRIEETFRKLPPTPVSVHDRTASTAAAVFFNSHDEPWLLLAQRTLTRQPCTEWFWRSAAPDWKPGLSAADTLRLCIRTLAVRGGLPLTLQLIAHQPPGISLEPLLQSLEAADLALVREALGFPLASVDAAEPGHNPPSAVFASLPPLNDLERRFVASWGPTDIRTHWLAAARLVINWPGRFSIAPVASVAAAQIQALVRHWHRESATNHPFLKLAAAARRSPPAPTSAAASASAAPTGSPSDPPPAAEPPLTSESPEPLVLERLFTQAGGLFFLIPLLQRAGFADFLETLSEAERAVLPWQLFKQVLRHARTDDGDTLVAALRDLPASPHPLGRWLLLANRHALRIGRLNLREVVRRPALVALNGTHIDVFFRIREADLRLRRSGLDLDPGWVPWLGRAVAYHFNRED